MLVLGDNQYNREGVSRDTPKSSKDVAKEAGVSKGTVDRTKKAIALDPDEAAVLANVGQIPADVVSGTFEDHIESMCLDNMQFDVSRGDIGQIFSAKEKREAIKRLLLLPKWWGRSNVWIGEDFGVSDVSILRYREAVGSTIVEPGELNLTQDQRVSLETEILKRVRLGKDHVVQTVPCKTAVTAFVEMVGKE